MKKFIALALTLAMALCVLAIPTFAEDVPANASTDVNVNIAENGTVETIYDIDIKWTDLTFTYTFEGEGAKWNPDSHAYESAAANASIGTWNQTAANITVTNHSNAAVTVTASKTDAENTNGVTFALTNTTLPLANAEGTARENAPSGTIGCEVSGVPTTKTTFKVTTITLAFN